MVFIPRTFIEKKEFEGVWDMKFNKSEFVLSIHEFTYFGVLIRLVILNMRSNHSSTQKGWGFI